MVAGAKMTDQEKEILKDILKKANRGAHLGYKVLKPSNRGQEISGMQVLINNLKRTAAEAGPLAAEAIFARVAELETRLVYWKSEDREKEWQEKQQDYEREAGLVSELEAVIPPEPEPEPPPPEDP